MIEIVGGFQLMKIDKIKYTKTLNRILGEIIREAIREWLRAVLKSVPERGGFPVLTGAAKSTLAPLGRYIKNVSIGDISPTGRLDRRAEGESKQEFNIVDGKGGLDFIYEFSWATTLLHYHINEYNQMPGVAGSPWHSIDKGEAAMKAYVDEALRRRLPKISDFIQFIVVR